MSALTRIATWLPLAGLLAFLGLCGLWRAQGGHWERVETPSMGTVAPVGTLLWVAPVRFDRLKPGDFISFHPPGRPDVTYSHRVLRREPDGTIATNGVISAPDPWRLTSAQLVGRVEMRWWGVGWLVTAAPVSLAGLLLIAAVRRAVRPASRLPATILLGSLVITAAITWYRPLINAQQLAFTPAAHGGADATYVGTGLLPIRIEAHDGPSRVLHDGQVGTVHVATPDATHHLSVTLRPAVPLWWWAVLVLGCFLPALAALVVGSPSGPGPVGRLRRS